MKINKVHALAMMGTLAVGFYGCGGSSKSGPCSGVSGTCVAFPAGTAESVIQGAFATAANDTTLAFGAGTFTFTNELSVTAAGVTVTGAGQDKTILDFSNQTSGGEGLLATGPIPSPSPTPEGDGNKFTIENLTVQNTKGNAVKGIGIAGFTAKHVHVTWTTSPNSAHGPYGLYPVQCSDVLLDSNLVEGASDSGIYVGQSAQIVVRNNTVQGNVAGIEIENSSFAEVYGNTAQDNTAGVLVFALPGLEVETCHDVLVHDNQLLHNNGDNFATNGDIVSQVPVGVGSFVMDSSNVEVRNNKFADNNTGNFAIVSYYDLQIPIVDPNYYPFPSKVYVHDNTFDGGGTLPSLTGAQIGQALAISLSYFPGNKVGDILYDNTVDPNVTATMAGNPMNICLGSNNVEAGDGGSRAATFLNINAPEFDMVKGFTMANATETPFECTGPTVAAVTFPGL